MKHLSSPWPIVLLLMAAAAVLLVALIGGLTWRHP